MNSSLDYLDHLDLDSLREAAEALGEDEMHPNIKDELMMMRAQAANFNLKPALLAQIILVD